METAVLLRELENLAALLDVDVRFDEDLDTEGGLCRFGGRTCLLVRQDLSPRARLELIATELATLPLGHVFIRPQVRELLETRLPAEARLHGS